MLEKLIPHVVDDVAFAEYTNLINKSYINYTSKTEFKSMKPTDFYAEKHHIFPKSMGGDDSVENMIWLSAKQHYTAHVLLYKLTKNKEMCFALNQMNRVLKRTGKTPDEELYAKFRSDLSKHISHMTRTRLQSLSDTEREKWKLAMSRWNKNKIIVRNKTTKNVTKIDKNDFDESIYEMETVGRKHKPETKRKISQANTTKNRGLAYHDPITGKILYFNHNDVIPTGWIKGSGIENKHTIGTVFYHNPETKEQARFKPNTQPTGWIKGRYKFNNVFTNSIIRKHILTGEISTKGITEPLWVSPRCLGIFTFRNTNNEKIATGTLGVIAQQLNLDSTAILKTLSDESKIITTRSNKHLKRYAGQHIKDVFDITFYSVESINEHICSTILKDYKWIT